MRMILVAGALCAALLLAAVNTVSARTAPTAGDATSSTPIVVVGE